MKRVFTLTAAILISALIFSQSPDKFSYQAVVRNSAGELVKSKDVGFKISVLQGSAGGTAVYVETHTVATNTNGLATLEIGGGSVLSGTFANIDWSAGPYYIKTEADPAGGGSFTITGTSELLSVPYALYAKNAGNGFSGIYSDLSGKPVIPSNTSQLTNDTGFITSYIETDPVYTGSQAANITSSHITKLSNLSGTNTGDQDLSGLATTTSLTAGLNAKVDIVAGKGLSSNDYTTAEQTKLAGLATVATTGSYNNLTDKPSIFSGIYSDLSGKPTLFDGNYNSLTNKPILFDGAYNSLTGKPAIPTTTSQLTNNSGFITSYTETDPVYTGSQAMNITSAHITKLSNLSGVNTGDQDLSGLATITALVSGLDTKVDKVGGKGLSTEDYTSAEKTKLTGISEGAEVNVNADWDAVSGDALILNKPTLASVATTGSYIDLINTPVSDGSETKVQSGTNISVAGSGTTGSPYIINATGSSGWGLTGNSGTSSATNFIGTTNEEALNIRVNNQPVLYFSTDRKFGFNTTSPSHLLHIKDTEIQGNELDDDMDGSVDETGQELVFTNYGRLGINTTAPDAELHVAGSVKITDGTQGAGKVLTSDANGMASWQAASSGSGWNLTGNAGIVDGTNFIGPTGYVSLNFGINNEKAGRIDPTGPVFIGYQAGNNNTAFANTGIGHQALATNTTGNFNTALGHQSLLANTTGIKNMAVGIGALGSNTTGSLNVAVGSIALNSNTTGTGNTAIGASSGVSSGALTNATAIGWTAKVSASNSLVLGGTGGQAVKVGIGVTAPTATLDVLGNIKIVDGTQGTGKVLTSDADGVATWQAAGGGGATLAIGDSYQGGKIFWIDATGQHGLIAANEDQSHGINWNNGTHRYTGTSGDGIYSGEMNTAIIVATQISDDQTGNFAAKLCADYSVTDGGVEYGDWYLPSKYELSLCYLQRSIVGNFVDIYYWSSTDIDADNAWVYKFYGNVGEIRSKDQNGSVRPVRRF